MHLWYTINENTIQYMAEWQKKIRLFLMRFFTIYPSPPDRGVFRGSAPLPLSAIWGRATSPQDFHSLKRESTTEKKR